MSVPSMANRVSVWASACVVAVLVQAVAVAAAPGSNEALVLAVERAHVNGDADAELKGRLALVEYALATGNAHGAVQEFHEIAAFYRRGGDKASAAAADLEAAQVLVELELWSDAHATLEQSEGDEVDSARLARRQHLRVVLYERRGETARARASLAAVNRTVTRTDWNRYLADDARRLGVGYGWPKLDRWTLGSILAIEWAALFVLVVVVYRRAARRDAQRAAASAAEPTARV